MIAILAGLACVLWLVVELVGIVHRASNATPVTHLEQDADGVWKELRS